MQEKKATIQVLSNVRACVLNVPEKVLSYLDKNLAEQQKGAEWSPRHRRFGGRWDGKKHHFHISPAQVGKGTFQKGLVHRVRKLLAAQGVHATTEDLRKNVAAPHDLKGVHADMLKGVSMSGAYDFQLEAVKAALRQEAGTLFMATNAGKSTIAAALVKALRDKRILYVVPKAILLSQAREDIAAFLGTIPETIGTIGGGKFDPKEITVAIINSVTPVKAKSVRAKTRNDILRSFLQSVDVVFLDEGHHAKATTWSKLMNALVNAQYRYLMSGTPFTGDNDLMVEAAAGPIIYEIRNDALIERGVSAKPKVRIYNIDKPNLLEANVSMFADVYDQGVVRNPYRNDVIAKIAASYARAGASVVVLVRILAQGADIRTRIAKLKTPVQFAHGKMHDTERDQIVDWYKETKRGHVMVGSNIFDEGVNIPQMNALIIGDGGKSLRAILQKVGRAIRKKKGANVVDVIDFADNTHRYLASHSIDRLDTYISESFEVVEEETSQAASAGETFDEGTSASVPSGEQAVSALPRKADRRRDVDPDDGTRGSVHSRTVHATAEQGEGRVLEERAIVIWRWRQTT